MKRYQNDLMGGNANSELAEMDPELQAITLCEALASTKFYLIFFSFFIGGGSGILLIDNVGQIVDGMTGVLKSDTSVFVTIISVANCWGRLLSGLAGDFAVKRGIPRPFVLAMFGSYLSFVLSSGCWLSVLFLLLCLFTCSSSCRSHVRVFSFSFSWLSFSFPSLFERAGV